MLKLYDEELSIVDFEKRFGAGVAEFVINGQPKIVHCERIEGDSIRCSYWNIEELKWSSAKLVPYAHFEEVLPMLKPGWYETPMGTFGLSYLHNRQWRHGYHNQRINLWPGTLTNNAIAHILTHKKAGNPFDAVDFNVLMGGPTIRQPHVSGAELNRG